MQKNNPSVSGDTQSVRIEPVAVSIGEAAKLLGICEKNMYTLAASDGFPTVRLGKRILIPVEGLRSWINSQAASAR